MTGRGKKEFKRQRKILRNKMELIERFKDEVIENGWANCLLSNIDYRKRMGDFIIFSSSLTGIDKNKWSINPNCIGELGQIEPYDAKIS